MRRSVATLLCAMLVAAPVLADAGSPDAASAKPKTKRVCRAADSGNPLFPTMKCRIIPVETAKADEPVPPAKPEATQVALAPEAPPR